MSESRVHRQDEHGCFDGGPCAVTRRSVGRALRADPSRSEASPDDSKVHLQTKHGGPTSEGGDLAAKGWLRRPNPFLVGGGSQAHDARSTVPGDDPREGLVRSEGGSPSCRRKRKRAGGQRDAPLGV